MARTQRLVTLTFLLLLAFPLWGSPLSKEDPLQSPKSERAIIYLYRSQRIATRVLPVILVNGREVAIFAPHRYFKLEVNPGWVEIAVSRNIPEPPFTLEVLEEFFRDPMPIDVKVQIDAAAGQSYFIRGQAVKNPPMMVVDSTEGEKEVRGLKEISCNFSYLRTALAAMQEARKKGGNLVFRPLGYGPLSGGRKAVCEDQ
jgi:hypothetical protein